LSAVQVEGLSKSFLIPRHRTWTLKDRLSHPVVGFGHDRLQALEDVSFDVSPGEFFAVIGHNGSGKSTLLRCLAGIHQPDAGSVAVNADIAPFIELGVGFHPQLAARDNVEVAGTLMGLRPGEARRRFPSVISFAELDEFIELPLANYSSGMEVRLAFSTSFQVDADLLLFDEVLAVGDEAFKRKCLDTFERLIDRGHTIVYVTHGLDTVKRFADRALLLERGRMAALGEPEAVIEEYDRRTRESKGAHRAVGGPLTSAPQPGELEVPAHGEDAKQGRASGLRRFADVTMMLSRAEFKLRYLDSAVGYLWSLAQPLGLFLVLYFVWAELFHPNNRVPHYELTLLLGIALYTFFSEASGHALKSLVNKGGMLRKIPFSPLALPVSSVLTSFVVYGLTLVVVVGFLLVGGIVPSLEWFEMVPVLGLLLVYTTGLSLLLSLLYVAIRDVEQIWVVASRLLFFLTPVFYPIELAPERLQKVVMINPLAVVTVQARHAMIDPTAPTAIQAGGVPSFVAALTIAAGVLVGGLLLYRRQARTIAERI
jgi:ABC-type polysaccharide/polyol phosphate transport system ATPase subunit/ABC-type polysaccharide/polyol phosphate export permease